MELFDRRNAPKRADTWFVYALVDSRAHNEIRYIGITNNPRSRLTLHLSQSQREGWKKSRWVGSVISSGGDVWMRVIASGLSQEDAMATEVQLIAEYRALGARLMNLTDGGDGAAGQAQSAETRAKRSAALKGRQRSPESTALQAEALRGRELSLETRTKMSAAHINRYRNDPAQIERQRQNTILRFQSLAAREQAARTTRERFEAPGAREAHSAVMARCNSQDPTIRERRMRSQRLNGPQSNSKTGFKGVIFDERRGHYRASIKIDGVNKYLGGFQLVEDAAKAYDRAALSAWGADCYLNYSPTASAA